MGLLAIQGTSRQRPQPRGLVAGARGHAAHSGLSLWNWVCGWWQAASILPLRWERLVGREGDRRRIKGRRIFLNSFFFFPTGAHRCTQLCPVGAAGQRSGGGWAGGRRGVPVVSGRRVDSLKDLVRCPLRTPGREGDTNK